MDRSKVPILGGMSISHEKSSAVRSDSVIPIGALPPGSGVPHRSGALGYPDRPIELDGVVADPPNSGTDIGSVALTKHPQSRRYTLSFSGIAHGD